MSNMRYIEVFIPTNPKYLLRNVITTMDGIGKEIKSPGLHTQAKDSNKGYTLIKRPVRRDI